MAISPLPLGTADLAADDTSLNVRCAVPEGGDLTRLQEVIAE